MTNSPKSTITGFRYDGATPTRYPGIWVWHQSGGLWRILTTDDMGDTQHTSQQYRTKAEAMGDLSAVAEVWSR